MKQLKNIVFIALIIVGCHNSSLSQCASQSNIYVFNYDGHSYEVVRENRTWIDALNCAVERGGYLVEINDVAEQNTIFNELTSNANIIADNTQNEFGTASVWLGGTDAGTEGNWVWDGNADGIGIPFWSGNFSGSPIGGQYTNWGTNPPEPDNAVGGQDHLTIIIKPTAVNYSLWNDLTSDNTIYYLIEYDDILSLKDQDFETKLNIYPNPFNDFITIENNNLETITKIEIYNLLGQSIKSFGSFKEDENLIDVSDLREGNYVLSIGFSNGETIVKKIVK